MKIASVELFTYHLPLKHPLVLSGGMITDRCGYLIKLTSDSGAVGWGEAAPLPGYSTESFDQARAVLARLGANLTDRTISHDYSGPSVRFETVEVSSIKEHSVRFSVEMAALNLLAADSGRSLAHLLSHDPADEILLNGLITDDDVVVKGARRMKREGFRTIKLKVGRGSIADDIERVRLIHSELGDDVKLRLDANRAWTFDDAIRFAEAVADSPIEYIEEPLADPSRLPEFYTQTGIPIALDESLLGLTADDLRKHTYAGAVVLKLTLLGGFETASALARTARELGMKVVVSSCFESGVGITALAQFAAAYGQPDVAAGLDTLGRFESDLLQEPIDPSGARINTAQAWRAARTVDESRLDRIDHD